MKRYLAVSWCYCCYILTPKLTNISPSVSKYSHLAGLTFKKKCTVRTTKIQAPNSIACSFAVVNRQYWIHLICMIRKVRSPVNSLPCAQKVPSSNVKLGREVPLLTRVLSPTRNCGTEPQSYYCDVAVHLTHGWSWGSSLQVSNCCWTANCSNHILNDDGKWISFFLNQARDVASLCGFRSTETGAAMSEDGCTARNTHNWLLV